MKKLTTLVFAFFLTVGMAYGQNSATTTQAGDDNESSIEQSAEGSANNGSGAASAAATVTQVGDENVTDLDQDAFFGNAEATIKQTGDNNYSGLSQGNGGGSATVVMEGDQNQLLNIDLDAESQATQKNDNVFDLDILGSQNLVGLVQEFATADVDISGNSNEVQLSQKSNAIYNLPGYFNATINLDGDGNLIDVRQGPNFGAGGTNNVTNIDVLGSTNDVDVIQSGDDNTSTINVTGNGNTASSTQNGMGNTSTITQSGGGASVQ